MSIENGGGSDSKMGNRNRLPPNIPTSMSCQVIISLLLAVFIILIYILHKLYEERIINKTCIMSRRGSNFLALYDLVLRVRSYLGNTAYI